MNTQKTTTFQLASAVLIAALLVLPGLAKAQTGRAPRGVRDTVFTTQPVMLLYINAFLYAGGGQVLWETCNELNSQEFVLEMSVDRKNWSSVGAMAAHPNDPSSRGYIFYDSDIRRYGVPVVYYRVEQVAQDRSSTFSPTRAVWLTKFANRSRNAGGSGNAGAGEPKE